MTFGFKKFVLYSINKAWTKQIKNCLPDRYQAAISQGKPALNRNGSSEVTQGAGLCPEWFATFSCALGVDADKIDKWRKCQQLSREWWGWGCHTKTSGSLREQGLLTQSQMNMQSHASSKEKHIEQWQYPRMGVAWPQDWTWPPSMRIWQRDTILVYQ